MLIKKRQKNKIFFKKNSKTAKTSEKQREKRKKMQIFLPRRPVLSEVERNTNLHEVFNRFNYLMSYFSVFSVPSVARKIRVYQRLSAVKISR